MLHSSDWEPNKKKKYGSKITVTKEFIKGYMGIPESVDIKTIEYQPSRELLTLHLGSDTPQRYMLEVGEAQLAPNVDPREWLEEAVKNRLETLIGYSEPAKEIRAICTIDTTVFGENLLEVKYSVAADEMFIATLDEQTGEYLAEDDKGRAFKVAHLAYKNKLYVSPEFVVVKED